MDKDLLEKLYDIFASTNKTGMMSRFMFNSRMNSKVVSDALSNIETFLNNMGGEYSSKTFSEEQLATIYLRLCESIDESELQELLEQIEPEFNNGLGSFTWGEEMSTDSSFGSFTPGEEMSTDTDFGFFSPEEDSSSEDKESENEKIKKRILDSLGLEENFNFDYVPLDCLAQMLMQPKGRVAEIYDRYKDTIFEIHLCNRNTYNHEIDWGDIEHQTFEDYYNLLNAEDGSEEHVRRSISEAFSTLISTYSMDELMEDKEGVDADVRIGLTGRLSANDLLINPQIKNFYLNNRTALRSVEKYLDEKFLERLEHAGEYLHQVEAFIKSGRFSGEELDMLTEMADCFSHLKLPDGRFSRWPGGSFNPTNEQEASKKVIDYILSEAPGDDASGKLPLAERLGEYIMSYECLLRQDITQNVTQINPDNLQRIPLEIASSQRPNVEIDGILIDSVQSFGNPMVHIFNNAMGIFQVDFYRYMGTKLIEDEIARGTKSNEEMRDLITNVANLILKSPNSQLDCSKNGEQYNWEISSTYKNMLELGGDVDEDIMRSYMTQYVESIRNNAQINQLDLGSQLVVDKIDELIDDDRIRKQFFAKTEPHISTQILRMRNLDDARNLPRSNLALIFDNNGLDPEAIIFSSNRNVETNNPRELAFFDEITPGERSANFETLKNEVLTSSMVRRDNNEIVLNRQAAKPSGLVFFGSRKLDVNGTKALIRAMETAKKSGLPLVFVDCDAICQDMDMRKSVDKKHDQQQDK